jgi:hypothetical protein
MSKTWHWLIKHPVEFSKNNHTPSNNPHQGPPSGAPHPPQPQRALLLRYPVVSVVSNRLTPLRHTSTHFSGHHDRTSFRRPVRGFGRPAAAVSRERAWGPTGRQPYPVGFARPNPPPDESGAPPGSDHVASGARSERSTCAPASGFHPVSSVPRWQRESYASGGSIVKSTGRVPRHTCRSVVRSRPPPRRRTASPDATRGTCRAADPPARPRRPLRRRGRCSRRRPPRRSPAGPPSCWVPGRTP